MCALWPIDDEMCIRDRFSRALECALGSEEARRMRLRARQCEPDEPLCEVSFEFPRMAAQELHEAYMAMFASAAGYFAMAETAKGTPDFEDFQSAAIFCGAVLQELKCRRMPGNKSVAYFPRTRVCLSLIHI